MEIESSYVFDILDWLPFVLPVVITLIAFIGVTFMMRDFRKAFRTPEAPLPSKPRAERQDVNERLRELKRLHASGLITETQYEFQQARILDEEL